MNKSRFLTILAAFFTAAVAAHAQGFAPNGIADSVFNGNITASTGTVAATGSLNEIFTSTGRDYTLSSVGTLSDPAPFVYTKTADNVATIVEPISGTNNQSLTVTLTFTSPNAGTFAATYGDGSGTQAGSFALNAVPSEAPLVNMSNRLPLAAGQTAFAGLVVGGGVKRRVLVRAVGPTLTHMGVSSPMADPVLTVYKGQTPIATNDNWNSADAATFAKVGAFSLDANSKDAAMVLTVDPGIYSVVVTSASSTAGGEILLETYFIE